MANVFSSPSLSSHPGLDEWVSVKPDGRVAVKTGKVDIGQRISTALAVIAAEELDVPLDAPNGVYLAELCVVQQNESKSSSPQIQIDRVHFHFRVEAADGERWAAPPRPAFSDVVMEKLKVVGKTAGLGVVPALRLFGAPGPTLEPPRGELGG